ncbi:uncharacterized protein C8R40DRAFT_1070391 [Lentinula edodes]|uniref:uncharacterized protein n=1 Tax=Lentinula edodes TaxID=5353 RepID=UPI001E8DC537|nr:uncharacterized protein C8R40DRAFT_1070391 [Lentinula edodes]KAH7874249.1 hypothetical protein C8R40DRAFT_1070391 [Lentinula edodes]KAJ3919784.1 hypothetical protein F5877DRAFT_66309 [Lentinula edodes]
MSTHRPIDDGDEDIEVESSVSISSVDIKIKLMGIISKCGYRTILLYLVIVDGGAAPSGLFLAITNPTMRLVAIWTSLALCLIPAVYAAPAGETHLQVPRTSLSKRVLSSRASVINVRLNDAEDNGERQTKVREKIKALAKIVGGAWGDKKVGNQWQFEFQDPPKRFPSHTPVAVQRFELLGSMKGCEEEVNGEWPCVGYIYKADDVAGDITSRIRKEVYDTMKLEPSEKWDGGPLR